MPQVNSILEIVDFLIPRVRNISGGDPDVYSYPGRRTRVAVYTDNLQIAANGSSVSFSLFYEIQEMRANWTTLQYRGIVRLDAPANTRIVQAGGNTVDVIYDNVFVGQNHQFNDVSNQVGGTYLNHLEVKFDGLGPDHEGNAQLKASIAIPVVLET